VASVNNLLAQLGTGISFLTENLEYLQFYGQYGLRSSYLITPTPGKDDLTNGVQDLIFDWGALLQTKGPAKAALNASIFGLWTIAAKANGTGSAGNVAVISSPSFVTNTYMTDPYYGGNHTRFASNLIDYLLPEQEFNIARRVTPERSTDGVTKTYLYVTDGNTGAPVTGLVGGVTINLTSSNPAVVGPVDFLNVTEQAPGIYVNTSFILGTANPSPYFFNATATVEGVHRNATGAAILISATPQITDYGHVLNRYPYLIPYLDYNQIDRYQTSYVSLSLTSSPSFSNVKVYAGSTPSSAFNQKEQSSFNKTMSGSGTFNSRFYPNGNTSGYYRYFFEGEYGVGYTYTNVYSSRDYFEVYNFDPEISKPLSEFNNQYSFSDLITSDGYYIPQEATQLESYSFSVYAEEQVDFEDYYYQLTGVVVFMPAYTLNNTVGLLIGSGDLPIAALTYAGMTGFLVGQITIPVNVTMPKGDGTDLEKSTVSTGNYIAIFEVAVMDTEGGYADYVIILTVASAFDPLLLILILVAVIGSIAAIVIVFYRRGRKQMPAYGAYQSPYETPSVSPAYPGYGYAPEQPFGTEPRPPTQLRKFCPYCGHPIPLEATQCTNCGANLPSMDPF
jgi:hypothetical protein